MDLELAFPLKLMKSVWRKTVYPGMRSQAALDLHDYFDVHRNLDALLQTLRSEVCSSTYRPRKSQIVRLEKSAGICRRLQLPSPEDAIILQTLVESISPKVRLRQPGTNAFYSRSHGQHSGPAAIDETFPYPWWQLWPEFQSRILKFTQICPYVIVTDVANYFDSIPLRQLRNVVASMGHFEESVIDFLFYMLDEFVWHPDYLPHSGVGLPQINFDAPRLLAHAYLFEADTLLKQRVGDNFVRWMDDINIGVESIDHGRRLLGELDDLLHTRGVRLNNGKTKHVTISSPWFPLRRHPLSAASAESEARTTYGDVLRLLGPKEAAQHFALEENRALTLVHNLLRSAVAGKRDTSAIDAEMKARFRRFWRGSRPDVWEKIVKRYLNIFGELRDPYLVKITPSLLHSNPSLRETIFRYFLALGYSRSRFSIVARFVQEQCVDDLSLFESSKLLVNWVVPTAKHKEIVQLAASCVVDRPGSSTAFTAALWLLAKYATDGEITALLRGELSMWSRNAFAARQVAAVTPRLHRAKGAIAWVGDTLDRSGQLDAVRVLTNLGDLGSLRCVDDQLRAYLVPSKHQGPYPLPKVLIARALLGGSLNSGESLKLRESLLKIVTDPVYRRLLSHIP